MKTFTCLSFICLFFSTCISQIVEPSRHDISKLMDPNQILDSTAYSEGVAEAKSYTHLAIRSVGDPDHLSSCDYYSYERYGVKLELTGDIIIGNQIFDKNKGFNSVMEKRIQDSIPDYVDSIGTIDPTWIPFDYRLKHEFLELFDFQIETDSTVLVTLIQEGIATSTFLTLEGVRIYDLRSKKEHDISDFYDGVPFKVRIGNPSKGYMGVDFSNYPNPSHICTGSSSWKLWIPFYIKEE